MVTMTANTTPLGSGSTSEEMSTVISPATTAGLPRFLLATGASVSASAERRSSTVTEVALVA